jgi:hypothetical protein
MTEIEETGQATDYILESVACPVCHNSVYKAWNFQIGWKW